MMKGGKKYEFGIGGESKPNPFAADSAIPLGSVGYRYRKWQVGDHSLVARTEVDAVLDDKGTDTFILVKALNEYDTKAVDWRKKVIILLFFLSLFLLFGINIGGCRLIHREVLCWRQS